MWLFHDKLLNFQQVSLSSRILSILILNHEVELKQQKRQNKKEKYLRFSFYKHLSGENHICCIKDKITNVTED